MTDYWFTAVEQFGPGNGESGYDLIEEGSGVSAVNNCGGFFGKAFENKDVSEVGLIEHYDLAKNIQKRLLELYPEEIHAYCDLWAIWRMDRLPELT